MKKQRIYIAGPMRGYPLFNFPLFDAVAAMWRTWGWEVVNPAEVDREQDGLDPENPLPERPFSEYMRRDIELILTVDAIAFLPAWERSQGARIEHTVATALGLKLYDAISTRPLTPP
jgi:hypothetical protein